MTTIPTLESLDDQTRRKLCARLINFDLWVIVKRGLYYRENAHGYTNELAVAWKLPI